MSVRKDVIIILTAVTIWLVLVVLLIVGLYQYFHRPDISWAAIAAEVINEKPENWPVHQKQAYVQVAAKNFKEAEREYVKAIVLSARLENIFREKSVVVCYELAGLYLQQRNWNQAIKCCEEALRRSPWSGEANYLLALCHDQKGEKSLAVERYQDSLRIEPHHKFADHAKRRILSLSMQPWDSRNKKTVEKSVSDVSIKNAIVVILPVNIKSNEEINRLNEIVGSIGDHLGITLAVKNPIRLLENTSIGENRQYDADKLSEVLYDTYVSDYRGHAISLIGVTDQDISISGCNYVFAQTHNMANIISYARMREEFYGQSAHEDLLRKRLIAQITTSIGRTLRLSACNRPVCAMSYVGSLRDLDKRQPGYCDDCASLFKGYVLARLGQYDQAFLLIDDYIKKYPTDSSVHYEKGMIYWKLENWERAIAEFEVTLKLDPVNTNAKLRIAQAKEHLEYK